MRTKSQCLPGMSCGAGAKQNFPSASSARKVVDARTHNTLKTICLRRRVGARGCEMLELLFTKQPDGHVIKLGPMAAVNTYCHVIR